MALTGFVSNALPEHPRGDRRGPGVQGGHASGIQRNACGIGIGENAPGSVYDQADVPAYPRSKKAVEGTLT